MNTGSKSFDAHALQGHKMTGFSPNGVDTIHECLTCGRRWAHVPRNAPREISPDHKVMGQFAAGLVAAK